MMSAWLIEAASSVVARMRTAPSRRLYRRARGLRAERRPTVATTTTEQAPLELLERAIPGATNDAMLELAYRVLDNLAERSEAAADVAIDADDRDVENEALAFVSEVDKMFALLWASSPPRLRNAAAQVDDAKRDIEAAIRNRRARLDGRPTALSQFSSRRLRRAHTAWEVERRRETRQSDQLLERANVTPDRVLDALTRALEGADTSDVRPMEVAIALLPELADASLPGRQRVVNRVGQIMRGLVAEGRIVQIRPDDYDGGRRHPHRYTTTTEVDDA